MEINNNFVERLKNKYQIVVARYNEDIKWLLPFKLVTIIYNKGDDTDLIINNFNTIKLKNVGRESHTYLYHIVNNYEILKKRTIFIQGRINDHKVLDFEDYFKDTYDFIAKTSNLKLDKLKTMIEHYGKWSKENIQKCEYTPYDWIEKVIGINLNEISNDETKVVWGANFSISREMIHRKPKIFYENLLRFLDYNINPEEGHYMERSWYILFHNNYYKKKSIGYIFFKYNLKHLEKDLFEKINKNEYNDIHIWVPIRANYDYGKDYKINFTPNNNKYNLICPSIKNNSFYIDIKGNNDAHILINFHKIINIFNELNETTIYDNVQSYEIVIGGWNNNISVIRDYNKNKILASFESKILDKNNYLKLHLSFNDRVIINLIEDGYSKTIFDIDNIYNGYDINTVMIKSYFGGEIFWNYDFNGGNVYLCNNVYEENNILKNVYNKYYAEYYIKKIDLEDLI